MRWPSKSPAENLDYQIDWSKRLGTDTIATSAWVVPSGITEGVKSNTTTVSTIWLSGGTLGAEYTLTNRITTAGGRTIEQSVTIMIEPK